MVRDIPDSVRAAMVRDPADTAACQELLRRLGDPKAIHRWFYRLGLLLDGAVQSVEGDILRRAMLSTKAIEIDVLRRTINAIEFHHNTRGMLVLFFAAALMATDRIDASARSSKTVAFPADKDNFQKVVSLQFANIEPATRSEAFNVSIYKHSMLMLLRSAGFRDRTKRLAEELSEFYRTSRRRFNPDGSRVLSWRWTFAIGHQVLAAFIVKGQDAGLFDFRRTRIWDGETANPALRSRMATLSPTAEFVPSGTMFAETFGAYLRERIDGRSVDLFEACGIVADRAGNERGGIMPPPGRDDPALTRFREAAGLAPDDRIVTLHCREGGFRVDGSQDLRNVDIAAYLPALRDLTVRGYRVVRMGDASMTPLLPMEGVFDYALSPLKSPELDVVLPGLAEFHIGSSSGLSKVPLLYGTPCLFLNWHTSDLLPWGRRNWTVLKPITRLADGRRITRWRDYAGPGQVYSRGLLKASGHDISNLTAGEVRQAVLEFAAELEAGHPEPAKAGRNLGRVLLTDDAGAFVDVGPDIRSADS